MATLIAYQILAANSENEIEDADWLPGFVMTNSGLNLISHECIPVAIVKRFKREDERWFEFENKRTKLDTSIELYVRTGTTLKLHKFWITRDQRPKFKNIAILGKPFAQKIGKTVLKNEIQIDVSKMLDDCPNEHRNESKKTTRRRKFNAKLQRRRREQSIQIPSSTDEETKIGVKRKSSTKFTFTDERQSSDEGDRLMAPPGDRFELTMKRQAEGKGVATFEAYVDKNEEANIFPVKIVDKIVCRSRVDEPEGSVVTMRTAAGNIVEITGRATVEIDLGMGLQLEIDTFLAKRLPFNDLIILGNNFRTKMQSCLEQKSGRTARRVKKEFSGTTSL